MGIVIDWKDYEPLFYKFEFDCRFSGKNEMQQEFMDRLTLLRKAYDKPMMVTSGYRDPSHPVEARKTHSKGEHTQGMCADIGCTNGADRYRLITLALQYGFHRIGVHSKFVHLGLGGEGLPSEVIWNY